MSSPPNTANSPPYPSSLNLPRKRPSLNTSISNSIRPNRAPSSVASSSAHPLRQTSFPPPEQAVTSRASSFSPTVDGSATGRSSTAGLGKRKRGRPKASDARSTTAGSARGSKADSATGKGSVANEGGDAGRDDDEAEDDEVEGGMDAVLEDAGTTDEAQLKVERQNMRTLIEAFSNDQADRYDMWRRVRLEKSTVRKLVNQTLSQSVPPSVITTVNGYTKLFIGELIERARDVQSEWLAASPTLPTGETKAHVTPPKTQNGEANDAPNVPPNGIKTEPDSMTESLTNDDATEEATQEIEEENHGPWDRFIVEERDRGPLTPDHLREALRRYKKDREGGSAGFQGLSMQGKTNVASRVGGKRLFR